MSHTKNLLLFYRNYRAFAGGHLKVWDYFNHVRHSHLYQPYIYFSPETLWDASNPWLSLWREALPSWTTVTPDALFLAGLDWQILSERERRRSTVPIINLIQGVRHTHPEDPCYPFLRHKAIRICVSQEVTTALADSGQVNGPLMTISNGLDTADFPPALEPEERHCDILIVALKQPHLGRQLQAQLASTNLRITLLEMPLLRRDFLQQLAQARITVFLPLFQEGFYLPALEGMAMGTLVICPDCIGNRSFCLPDHNCLRPVYTLDVLLTAIHKALHLTDGERHQLQDHARATVTRYDLVQERQAFLHILQNLEHIW